jgi:hypothetical protein
MGFKQYPKSIKINKTNHPDNDTCFEGQVTIEVIDPPKEIALKDKYPDYETYLKDWHGIEDITKQGYWTNSNARWDWYQIGGRWTGMFKLKKGTMEFSVGKPSLISDRKAKPGWADQCRKKDIDFEGMRDEAEKIASKDYDIVVKFFGGKIPTLKYKWNELLDDEKYKDLDHEEKRTLYKAQQPIMELRERREEISKLPEEEKTLLSWFDFEDYMCTKEEYIQRARDKAIITFAVLKDGQWYERGKMGWWACVSDEKNNWEEEFNKLLESISEDTLLTVVDCHI